MKKETQRVSRRIEQHPDIVLRLESGARRPRRDRIRLGLIKVIDPDVEMQHLLLFSGLFRPHWGLKSRLGLE